MTASRVQLPRQLSVMLLMLSAFVFPGCKDDEPPKEKAARTNNLEARRQHIKQQETKVSKEAQARKDRSISILESENVPFSENLPLIETEAESRRRTTEEVALRAMALCIVAAKGEGRGQQFIDELSSEYAIASSLTPEEKQFITNPTPSERDHIQFAWRYETYWVMLWALGFVEKLERPDKMCDVGNAVSMLRERGREGFLKDAQLRPQREILDAADLIYRYHWAVREAYINNREAPAGLDGDVVMERHYALNWLIGYNDAEWDDVTTDT